MSYCNILIKSTLTCHVRVTFYNSFFLSFVFCLLLRLRRRVDSKIDFQLQSNMMTPNKDSQSIGNFLMLWLIQYDKECFVERPKAANESNAYMTILLLIAFAYIFFFRFWFFLSLDSPQNSHNTMRLDECGYFHIYCCWLIRRKDSWRLSPKSKRNCKCLFVYVELWVCQLSRSLCDCVTCFPFLSIKETLCTIIRLWCNSIGWQRAQNENKTRD